MSETKHTPGPWAICEEPAPNDYWFPGITIGAESEQDARRVCDVFTGGMKGADINPMHAANARLIAAAPDLLAVLTNGAQLNMPDFLEWIAARLVNVHGDDPNIDFVQTLRHRAKLCREAIAAATGETP